MMGRSWLTLCCFTILVTVSSANSLTIGPYDEDVNLSVDLEWRNTKAENSNGGIVAKLIITKDEIIVDRWGITPQADNEETGCANKVKNHYNKTKVLSIDDMRQILDCQSRMSVIGAIVKHPSIILNNAPGPRHCKDIKLSNGTYGICAQIFSTSSDSLSMEYEETTKIESRLSVSRVRFDLNLSRQSADASSPILGCTAKIVAAFSLNPKQPNKLAPFDHVISEQCERDAA